MLKYSCLDIFGIHFHYDLLIASKDIIPKKFWQHHLMKIKIPITPEFTRILKFNDV